MKKLFVFYIVAGVLAYLAVRKFMRTVEQRQKVAPAAYGTWLV